MLNTLRRDFAPPIFPEDDNKTRSAYYINVIVLINIPVLLFFFLARILQGNPALEAANLVLLGLVVVLSIVWLLMKKGFVKLAGYIHISMIWIASTFLALNGSGIHGSGFVSYFVVMLLAGLLLGSRSAVGVATISVLSGFGLAYAETIGIIALPPLVSPFGIAIEYTVLFIFSTTFMVLTINSLQNALTAANKNAREFETSNKELTTLRDQLESHIQERTASLEKRAAQLQTVSRVARNIVSIQDLSVLLPNITRLVSEQFGFYHAGIFLINDARSHAVLKAANSEGGKRMLARGHQLALDSNSIVGYATSRGEPRIALDVGADTAYFNNPDLPDTRAEMALPLRVSGKVIGALDVQSTETGAFSSEEIEVLSTLADQVAIAIENARLFGNAQNALSESQSTFEKYVKQEWSNYAQQVRHTGFVFDGKQVTVMDNSSKRDQVKSVVKTGSLVLDKGSASSSVSVPIKLRGQTIGVIDIRSKRNAREWTREEIMLLEAAAERAALALENARLLENAQRRASRERTIGEISSRIGSASDFNSILRTTVEEMGRRIGATEVVFELETNADKDGGEN